MSKNKKPDLQNLKYRFNKVYKQGNWRKAKEVSEYAKSIHGVDIDEAYHANLEQKEDYRDPYKIGRTRKIKYG